MTNRKDGDKEFAALFRQLHECKDVIGVVLIPEEQYDELDEIRVLREAVEETMDPPQVYFSQA